MIGILGLFVALQMPGYVVNTWGVDDGAPSAVTSILRSSDGYLWFGSFTGLARFDGLRFVRIPNLPNAQVIALHQDRAGDIWLGTNGGGLIRMRNGEFQSWTTAQGLSHDTVFAVEEDDAGGMWAGTPGGLNLLKDGHIRVFRAPELPVDFVRGIQRGPSGRLWVTTEGGVCEIHGEELSCGQVPLPEGINRLNAGIEARDGAMWIGTAGFGFKRIQGTRVTDFAGRGEHVASLMESRNGDIWVGYGRVGGVSIVRDDQVLTLGENDGLPRNTVRAMYEDPEGSIWLATDGGGVARLRPKRATAYTRADGLPHDVVKSITQTADGTIWAGFNCGPASRWNGARFEPMFEGEIGNVCTFATLGTRDGSLWIGSWGNGLFRWQNGRLTRLGMADGLSSNAIELLYEDSNGGLWVATEGRDLDYIRDGTVGHYAAADGIGSPRVTAIAETPDGRIWICSGDALSVLANGKFEKVSGAGGLPPATVGNLFVDRQGVLWVSTSKGLFRRQGDRFVSLAGAHPSLSGMTGPMAEDRSGNLWIGVGLTLTRFLRSELEAFATGGVAARNTIVLDRSDGLPAAPDGTSAVQARDGTLWFATLHGIFVIDPADVSQNPVPPPAVIETPSGRDIRIPAGTPTFEFQYAGLSLLDPQKVRFRYQLEGFDADWVDAGTRRTAYYTRMQPGEYTFSVMAANNDGIWGAPAAVGVVVEPFLWETRGFQALVTMLVLSATVLSTRTILVRRTRKRFEALERERALDNERTRIARDLHDELGARLTRIALMADRGRTDLGGEARSAIQSIDELVWTVNARNDTVEAFATYALAYAQELLQAANIRLRLETPEEIPRAFLNAEVRRHLFMAFKEALNNVVKHSGASHVHLAFRIAGTLQIEIRDDGRGFDLAARSTGNGLPGMDERLHSIGGRADVISEQGGGTTIRLTLTIASP